VSPSIPNTAPYAADEIELLNRVVTPATQVQRAWLAGFLAGVDASGAAAAPAAEIQAAEPLTIVYATESGNSERLAGDVAKAARKNGLKPTLIDMADLDVASLADVRRLVVIAATWGEGEPPARAQHTYKALMAETAPQLTDLQYAVLALGDTAYVEFCAIGKAIDERLAALGG
jgi:sulfite reductase (NADPH) flavoprotein alpha-component